MHTKLLKSIASSILSIIISGLVVFVFNFFYDLFPKVESRIFKLESEVLSNRDYLGRIDNKLQRIYEILLEEKKN